MLGVRYLEGMVCSLMAVMAVCFFINWRANTLTRTLTRSPSPHPKP